MSSIINKVKAAVTPNHSTTSTTTTHAEGVHGPHSSRAANAADPRVDSDRDGSSHIAHGTHTTGTGVGHSTHTTGTGVGHSTHATGTGVGHSTHTTGTGLGSSHTGTGYNSHASTTTAGPHSSNLANKADPRVDSDRSNLTHTTNHGSGLSSTGHTGGHVTSGHTGTTGGISHSTNAGPHDSNLANKADPRVDSDLDSTGNRHGAHTGGILGASGSHATPGSGTAQNTAGPHNSDLLNKLDPRVDADLDGSKTIGGNKTHH